MHNISYRKDTFDQIKITNSNLNENNIDNYANYGSNSMNNFNNINLNLETSDENILNFDKIRKYSYSNEEINLNEPVLRKRTLSIVMDRINTGKLNILKR